MELPLSVNLFGCFSVMVVSGELSSWEEHLTAERVEENSAQVCCLKVRDHGRRAAPVQKGWRGMMVRYFKINHDLSERSIAMKVNWDIRSLENAFLKVIQI